MPVEPLSISISRAGADRLDELEPLWRAVQEHHAAVAPTLGGLGARSAEASWRSAAASMRRP